MKITSCTEERIMAAIPSQVLNYHFNTFHFGVGKVEI